MNEDISGRQLDRYRENFLKHGDSPEGTFQNNRETQHLRFERLLQHLKLPSTPFSIHDVGAGVADLHNYLLSCGIPHQYEGTEIVPEMVKKVKERLPDIRLTTDDFLSAANEPVADFVVLSGTLNLRCEVDVARWEEYSLQVLSKMYAAASCGISANFLTNRNTFSVPELFYAPPARILNYCLDTMSRFVTVDHCYPLFEFTVTVLKPPHVQRCYSDPAFGRYFPRSR